MSSVRHRSRSLRDERFVLPNQPIERGAYLQARKGRSDQCNSTIDLSDDGQVGPCFVHRSVSNEPDLQQSGMATVHCRRQVGAVVALPGAQLSSEDRHDPGRVVEDQQITGINVIARNVGDPFVRSRESRRHAGPGRSGRTFEDHRLTPGAKYVVYIDQIALVVSANEGHPVGRGVLERGRKQRRHLRRCLRRDEDRAQRG